MPPAGRRVLEGDLQVDVGSGQDGREGVDERVPVVGDDVRSRPQRKMQAFAEAGIPVARLVTDVGALVTGTLERAANRST